MITSPRLVSSDLPWLAHGAVTGLLLVRFAFGWSWIALVGAVIGVGAAALALMLNRKMRPNSSNGTSVVTPPRSRRISAAHFPWLAWGALLGGLFMYAAFGIGWATAIGVVCGLGGSTVALLMTPRAC